jgi:hypothetical protein
MGGEGGKFLTDRPIPQQLAVRAEGNDRGPNTKRVDVASLGVGRRRRPTNAVRGYVTLEDIEAILPHHGAGIRVESHDPFLQLSAFASGILHVHAVAHHDRG